MIRSFEGAVPAIADSAYVDEAAVVVGDVTVGEEANVWPNATIRGDSGPIRVGARATVQDNTVLHGEVDLAENAAVGHGGVVNQATVGEDALVGINATVLDDADVGDRAIVAAGAVVTEGTVVPPETLVAGVPAEHRKDLDGDETSARAPYYAELGDRHRRNSEPVDER